MPTERVIHEYDTDDDVVIVERGGGSSLGVILGILLVLLVLAAVWWFALGPGTAGSGTDVNINVPAGNQPASS
jgi:hypothetical protein